MTPIDTLISFPDGIHTIDALYQRPRLAAFFDTGTNFSLPQVLDALRRLGLDETSVDFVIPSHVHLDHAGGAGAMMRAFPNARLVVHPRGARHMADPSKLVAGTIAVYGEAATREMYGEIVPVPAGRIIEATDGLTLDLAGRTLTVLDTPGHARHHICLVDGKTGSLFTGDMFGLSYRQIDAYVAAAEGVAQLAGEARHAALLDALRQLITAEKARQGWRISDAELIDWLAADLELNAQGLEIWLDGRG